MFSRVCLNSGGSACVPWPRLLPVCGMVTLCAMHPLRRCPLRNAVTAFETQDACWRKSWAGAGWREVWCHLCSPLMSVSVSWLGIMTPITDIRASAFSQSSRSWLGKAVALPANATFFKAGSFTIYYYKAYVRKKAQLGMLLKESNQQWSKAEPCSPAWMWLFFYYSNSSKCFISLLRQSNFSIIK